MLNNIMRFLNNIWNKTPSYLKGFIVLLIFVFILVSIFSYYAFPHKKLLEFITVLVLYSLFMEIFTMEQTNELLTDSVTKTQFLFIGFSVALTISGVFINETLNQMNLSLSFVQMFGLIMIVSRYYASSILTNNYSNRNIPIDNTSQNKNSEFQNSLNWGIYVGGFIAFIYPVIILGINRYIFIINSPLIEFFISIFLSILFGIIVFLVMYDKSREFLSNLFI